MRVNRARIAVSFVAAVLCLFVVACAPPKSEQQSAGDVLELTDEMILERINYGYVEEVPEENGATPPIPWRFFPNEPKEITIVEKTVTGNTATVILDIKTQSGPRTKEKRHLQGQIRTIWELKTGFALRKWQIVQIENISLKYKNLPKSAEQISER